MQSFSVVLVTMALIFGNGVTTPEDDAAAYPARKLIRDSSWGVISSLDYKFNNVPFGNAVSFSDGGKGTPYFYLTELDEATANFSRVDARSSLSVSQYALGTCANLDPQEPRCVKVTLLGTLLKVRPGSREAKFANATLFQRHPRFDMLPAIAKFQLYKLTVTKVFVLNGYGKPKFPALDKYFGVKL